MKKYLNFRSAALTMAILGGLAAPTPALADPEELHECLNNCYQAYVVQTQQPGFYQMCRANCFELYDNFAASTATSPLGVLRYG